MFEKPIFHSDGFVQHGLCNWIISSLLLLALLYYCTIGLTRFGAVRRMNPRRWSGFADWYNTGEISVGYVACLLIRTSTTGKPRTIYRYGDIGLTKALLAHNHGDILQLNESTSSGSGSKIREQHKKVHIQRLHLSVEPVLSI